MVVVGWPGTELAPAPHNCSLSLTLLHTRRLLLAQAPAIEAEVAAMDATEDTETQPAVPTQEEIEKMILQRRKEVRQAN